MPRTPPIWSHRAATITRGQFVRACEIAAFDTREYEPTVVALRGTGESATVDLARKVNVAGESLFDLDDARRWYGDDNAVTDGIEGAWIALQDAAMEGGY